MISLLLSTAFTGLAGAVFHRLPFLPWYMSYSDVWKLFRVAELPGWPYIDFNVEYPVLLGLFMKLAAILGFGSRGGYYSASALLLIAAAVAVTFFLARMIGLPRESALGQRDSASGGKLAAAKGRLWIFWACAPSLLIFLLVNWDILAILPAVAALYAAYRGKPVLAAALLAVGTSAKLYPAIYLLPLLFSVPTWSGRLRLIGSFALTLAAINIPFAIANFDGWFGFFSFNSIRDPNLDSIWALIKFVIPELSQGWINILSLLAFLAGIALVWPKIKRAPLPLACLIMTLLFLLTNKVFSSQYVLWLLPLYVLTGVLSRRTFYLFELVNIAVFFLILGWQASVSGQQPEVNILLELTIAGVLIRHIMLFFVLLKTLATEGKIRATSFSR